ncbi:MAG TPA: hypothetical protein VJ912_03375 [Candidatus Nanoarchaeia archaeon]|nr:hypothetical protein [Candidatus Nanoarchaeia archaeon]
MNAIDKKVKLLKDEEQPELSEEIEKFLQEKNIPYIPVLGRKEQGAELPAIFTKDSFIPYAGRGGFNRFIGNYKNY